MNFRSYLLVFVAAFAGAFFLASCLNEENKIPPNCYDGILNNGEINIDCGGANCEECDHCTNGVWEPDRGETWRDCGGECPVCPTCSNGIMDGTEVAIDCGGDCGACDLLCGDGLQNGYEDDIDCENETDPIQGGCPYCPTCIDEMMNGNETGIDCGGSDCEPCCTSNNCRNGIKDGAEFDVDCGGLTCPDCLDTLTFKIGSETYFTPRVAIVSTAPGGTLTYSDNPAFILDDDAPPFPVGTLSLLITQPGIGWLASLNSPIVLPNINIPDGLYSIVWTDELGDVYTSADLEGSSKFTMVRYDTEVVPDDEFDGCHKPAGTYTYYRGTFQGSLVSALGDEVNLTQGNFAITFYVP
jgi:hypothetical protein